MRKYADSVVTVAIALIVTLVINFGVGYLFRSKGSIAIGNRFLFQGTVLRPVDIANQRSEPLDGLVLSLPKTVQIADIAASSPIQIADVPDNVGASAIRRIKLSGISPNAVVRLLIPVQAAGANDQIELVNARQIGIDVINGDEAPDLRWSLLKSVLVDSIVYAIAMGLMVFFVVARLEERRAEHRRLEEKWQKARDEAGNLKAETTTIKVELRKDWARVKLLLLARISDYSRELEYWRDTVRRIIYVSGASKDTAEALLNEVTASLKTYSTRASASALDFNTITTMAGMLSAAETSRRAGPEKPAEPEEREPEGTKTGTA